MADPLEAQLVELKKLEWQRKAWLVLSAFAVTVIAFLIFDTDQLTEYGILWPTVIVGITVSLLWWYWAMQMIKKLVIYRTEETKMLMEICSSIKELKEDIHKTIAKDVD